MFTHCICIMINIGTVSSQVSALKIFWNSASTLIPSYKFMPVYDIKTRILPLKTEEEVPAMLQVFQLSLSCVAGIRKHIKQVKLAPRDQIQSCYFAD